MTRLFPTAHTPGWRARLRQHKVGFTQGHGHGWDAAMKNNFRFGVMDGQFPAVLDHRTLEVWAHMDAGWIEQPGYVALYDVGLMPVAQFRKRFPRLPPLPAHAFGGLDVLP